MSVTPSLESNGTSGVTSSQALSLSFNDLAGRLLAYIDEKRDPTKHAVGQRSGGKRFSIRMLSRKSGLGYESVKGYIVRRTTRMSLEVCDALMYGLGISVLDLIQPHDLAKVYDKLDRQTRYTVRKRAVSASGESPSTKD